MSASTPVVPQLAVVNGHPVTTSLNVAEVFGKQHKAVLKAIGRVKGDIDLQDGKFAERNFALGSYLDANNQPRPMYNITRDGFTLLAMGFTGKAAMQFKLAYIEAFNRMEQELQQRDAHHRRVDIEHNAERRLDNPHGLDIRYTVDLTRAMLHPTADRLRFLQQLTGISFKDVIVENNTGLPSLVEQFLAAHLIEDERSRIRLSTLYDDFVKWLMDRGEKPRRLVSSKRSYYAELREQGLICKKVGGTVYALGVALKEVL